MKLVDKCEIPIYSPFIGSVLMQFAGLVLIALVTMLVTQNVESLYLCCHHKKCITIIILV